MYSWFIALEIFRLYLFLDGGCVAGVNRIQTCLDFCMFYINFTRPLCVLHGFDCAHRFLVVLLSSNFPRSLAHFDFLYCRL